MHKIFWVSLSAAILAARLSGAAETPYDTEIDRIEELVERGNWVELRGFLRSRPDLVAGDDAFSRELKNFLGQTSGLYSALIIDQVKYPDVRNAPRTSKTDSLFSDLPKPSKPPVGDSDLLLEAELAALKGIPEVELRPELSQEQGGDPSKLKLNQVTSALAAPEDADGLVEVASLDVGPEEATRGRSSGGFESANGAADDGDFSDDEPDAAVTSARDSGPSIY